MNTPLNRAFVALWQRLGLDIVCETLQMTRPAATDRAAYMRRNGVPLVKYKRGRRAYDWASLSKGL